MGDRPGEALRPLSWGDLVARLSAARDLRAALRPAECDGEGSFDAGCARRIAAHHNGKHGVNLDDLADSKGPANTGSGAAPATWIGSGIGSEIASGIASGAAGK